MDTNRPSIYPSLADKTVFITGGGSGIGAAFTSAFALQGARVGFVDIAEQASRSLIEQIHAETKAKPLFIPCDIREIEALRGAIEKVRAELGDIGVLINNAASDDRHACAEVTPSYWDERIAVNLRHMFFAAQAVLPQMKRRRRDRQSWLYHLAPEAHRSPRVQHQQSRGHRIDPDAGHRVWAFQYSRQHLVAGRRLDRAADEIVVHAGVRERSDDRPMLAGARSSGRHCEHGSFPGFRCRGKMFRARLCRRCRLELSKRAVSGVVGARFSASPYDNVARN